MLKLSKSAQGLLNAQYRSILKKCFYLNTMIFLGVTSTAYADGAIVDFNGNGEVKVEEALSSLRTKMGNTIGIDKDIGTLYVNEKQTNSLYSNDSSTYASWIINFNKVYIGYKYENGKPAPALDVEISNRHNTDADIIYFGGGVITNGGGNTNNDAILAVNNVKFRNNTASSSEFSNSDPTMYIASGGVINNFSVETANITNNQFLSNYVMSGGAAKGGAIYNGTASNQTGAVRQGIMNIENNLFQGNYAGNITSDSKLAADVGNVVAQETSGGAIYNTGVLNSKNDIFKNNFSIGIKSYGGAIYNGSPTNNTGGEFVLENTTGEINFVGNYVKSDSAGGSAYGGAIYNEGKFTLSDSTFLENYSDALDASGGAIYNTGNFISENNVFQKNYANNGGALHNTGIYTSTNEKYDRNYVVEGSGGAIYNEGAITFNNITEFLDNYITENGTGGNGGAIYNSNTLTFNDTVLFSANYIEGNIGQGGSIYNSGTLNINGEIINDNYIIKFVNNEVRTIENASGGAISNTGTSNINNVLFSGNVANSNNSSAKGGAIYSTGKMTITNSEFIKNSIQGSATNSGGAIMYNSTSEATIKDSNFIENTIIFDKKVSIASGGAISNGENKSTEVSKLSVISENKDVKFSNNKIISSTEINENTLYAGGAIFNDYNGLMKIITKGHNITFNNNIANEGGAIYNRANGEPAGTKTTSQLSLYAENGNIYFKDNIAEMNGGAIYNSDKANINIQDNSVIFENNNAQTGGALYNKGNLIINLGGDADLVFNENVSSENIGGAIYNGINGDINISISGNSKLTFNSIKDSVYNLGEFSITGDLSNTSLSLQKHIVNNLNIPEISPQVILNSTFGGEGTYNLKNIQLVLNEGAYIDNEPVLNLEGNKIYLNTGTYFNLNENDNITNNSFYISEDAVINYTSDGSEYINFANNIINKGVININDNIQTHVIINTLNTEDGLIKIDVDNSNLIADRIVINDKIYGKTHILFDNSNSLALDEDDRIYFAQTQAEQSLSEYSFSADINGNIYEIAIGNEVDGISREWFFYRTDAVQPEIMAYIDLPRAGIEQSRSLLYDVNRIHKGGCECTTGRCNVRLCNFKYMGTKQKIWAKPIYRFGSFDKPVETDFSLYGLDFGYDIQNSLYNQFGFFGSVRNGTYENEGKAEKFYANYNSELDITSVLAGAYYRRYFGDLYINGAILGGLQMVDTKAENGVTASTDGLNLGVQTEIGYDIRTTKRSILTPSVKVTYDYIKFDDLTDDSGKKVTFDDIHDIELEAGMKFEYQFNEKHQLPTTGYIKPSVVHMVSSGGDVTISDTIFDETIEDGTYWRLEVGADADLIKNFSVGAFGNYTAGSGYDAWMIGGNIRYIW